MLEYLALFNQINVSGSQGTPFGIKFWYEGNEAWTCNYQRGAKAESGCVGCGWYDFDTWRKQLNKKLSKSKDA